jgi:hypothetical protein
MAASIDMAVLRAVALCSLGEVQSTDALEVPAERIITLMETASISKTSANFYQPPRNNNPEDNRL